MKTFLVAFAATLAISCPVFAQTTSFDITTFVQPRGWKRTDAPGVLTLQDQRTVQGRSQFCQIFIFSSQPGDSNPNVNFLQEWQKKVATPLRYGARPNAGPVNSADGWTSVTDHADAMMQGVPIRVILFTATKAARFVTVAVTVSPNSYQNELVNFFQSLNLHDSSGGFDPSSPAANPAGPTTTNPPPGRPSSGSLSNYVYTVPAGWNQREYPDRIALTSPVYGNGEACQITILPFQDSALGPADVALGTFRQVFRTDPLSTYPAPPGIMAKGVTPGGWEYFSLRKLVGGQEGEARTRGAIVLSVKADGQVGTIVATSKDFMVSNCFGLLRGDSWSAFFYSLQLKNARISGAEAAQIRQRLAGSWIMATGSAGLHFAFQPNGRYADAVATQYRTQVSPSQELQTTTAYFGDGSYSFDKNTLVLQRDDHRRFVYQFRLEQVSRDSGQSWKDELDMLEPGASGEVTYRRD